MAVAGTDAVADANTKTRPQPGTNLDSQSRPVSVADACPHTIPNNCADTSAYALTDSRAVARSNAPAYPGPVARTITDANHSTIPWANASADACAVAAPFARTKPRAHTGPFPNALSAPVFIANHYSDVGAELSPESISNSNTDVVPVPGADAAADADPFLCPISSSKSQAITGAYDSTHCHTDASSNAPSESCPDASAHAYPNGIAFTGAHAHSDSGSGIDSDSYPIFAPLIGPNNRTIIGTVHFAITSSVASTFATPIAPPESHPNNYPNRCALAIAEPRAVFKTVADAELSSDTAPDARPLAASKLHANATSK